MKKRKIQPVGWHFYVDGKIVFTDDIDEYKALRGW